VTFEDMRDGYQSYEAMARDLFDLWRIQCAATDLEQSLRRRAEDRLQNQFRSIRKPIINGETA
jgi:hypothetical protein